jgi:RNA polymerase sigma-70 factor (ECF subfamily)
MGEARVEEKRSVAPGSTESSTLELARVAAQGDSAATAQLLRVLAPRIARVVRAVLGAAHPDVDDAIQQALIGLVQALPAFRGECDPLGYASIIAVRAAVVLRKRTRTELSRRDDGADAEALATHRPSPGDEAAAQRRKQVLRDLLSELPAEQGEALALRVVLGWSLEEIAARSGAPLNTVRSRLRLAKEGMKRRIEAEPGLAEALEVEP